jgi:F-type H+-transporting ATPase subunit a
MNDIFLKLATREETQHATEHAAEHVDGADFIMHHILAQPVVKLPTVFGIDLTITNHIIMMWIVSALLVLLFYTSFKKRPVIPKGLANLLEAIVFYVRNELIRPNLGRDSKKYAPYLLTAFFFIMFANLLGLFPGAATATGNISVTATLAILTLIVGQYAAIDKFGARNYFNQFIPPGLPKLMLFIMVPVEIVSLVAKHVALAIRLFANMIAGHIVILAIMSLIFLFKSWLIAPFPLLLIIFSALLEILISLIQAYVFTMLSAVFIGAALAEEH